MHSLHSAASYLYTNYENVMSQPGKGFLVWLAGLSVLGFLATDMYLPAFAAMQQDLNTSAASISASRWASCSGDRCRTAMDVNRCC